MSNVKNDAYKLASRIGEDTIPGAEWKIVNIGQTENEAFTFTNILAIPKCYGYMMDDTPDFLVKIGVFEATDHRYWYVKQELEGRLITSSPIVKVGNSKGYFDGGVRVYLRPSETPLGPSVRGMYMVLVNLPKLRSFIDINSQTSLSFNFSTGLLQLLGESVVFKGELTKKSVQLLVERVNSRVTPEEFFRIPRGEQLMGDMSVNSAEKKMFEAIRGVIEANKGLKKKLICVQKEGFGFFIDRRSEEG